jgi:integrase
MPRPRTGAVVKKRNSYFARIRWVEDGKICERARKASSRTEARNLIRILWAELDREQLQKAAQESQPAERPSPRTFNEFADIYLAERVQPPMYIDDRKVSGMRAHKPIAHEVTTLKKHFGSFAIGDITYADIEYYKRIRLASKTHHDKQRKLGGFNHELRRLRAMFNFAIQNRWITINPFHQGPSLISAADEISRNRPRQPDEEKKLLAACVGKRSFMKLVIILAIDTAARRGEILGLRRKNIDFGERLIRLPHTITKTARERVVPISDRLEEALRAWLHFVPNDPEAKIFGDIHPSTVSHAFIAMCRDLELPDLRFHDLRHWATTDIVNAVSAAGIAPQHAMQITGHSTEKTFRRYLRTDNNTVRAIGDALQEMKKSEEKKSKGGTKGGTDSKNEGVGRSPIHKLRRIK